ncbi:MAG: radical SAM protein [Syntrophales bacterium]
MDRTAGEKGYCSLCGEVVVSRILPHHGEEPPISGDRGAGTIFFSSCNLRCVFCQNYQISFDAAGSRTGGSDLSAGMLRLQQEGCHNVEAVTPTPHLPGIIEALFDARRKGLDIPFVYNCGGYENPRVLKELDGIVDIYLPDFKYGRAQEAEVLAEAGDYPEYAVESIREMIRQVGGSLEVREDVAVSGIIIRHLVLPGMTENSMAVLKLIRERLSTGMPISIMSQYTPVAPVADHPLLGRRVTKEEYDIVVDYALDLGFETIFIQDVDERQMTPDFEKDNPFG